MPVLENLHIFLIWGMDSELWTEFTMLWFYGEKNNIKNLYIRGWSSLEPKLERPG